MTDIIEMLITENELFRFSMITTKGNSCFLSIPKSKNMHIRIIDFDMKPGTSEFVKDINNIEDIVKRAFKKHDLENICLVIPLLPKDFVLVSIDDYEKLMSTIDSLFISVKSILDDKKITYENVIGIVKRNSFEIFLDWYIKSTSNKVEIIDLNTLYRKENLEATETIVSIAGKNFIKTETGELKLIDVEEQQPTLPVEGPAQALTTREDPIIPPIISEERPIIIKDVPVTNYKNPEQLPVQQLFDDSSTSQEKGRSRILSLPSVILPSPYDSLQDQKLPNYALNMDNSDPTYQQKAGHIAYKLIIAFGIILYAIIIWIVLTKK